MQRDLITFARTSLLMRSMASACGLVLLLVSIAVALMWLLNVPIGSWPNQPVLHACALITLLLEAKRIFSRLSEFDRLTTLLEALTQSYHVFPPDIMKVVIHEMHKCKGREQVYDTVILTFSGGRQASLMAWTDHMMCSEEYAERSTRTTFFEKVCAVYTAAKW